jgi:hypothetical protein
MKRKIKWETFILFKNVRVIFGIKLNENESIKETMGVIQNQNQIKTHRLSAETFPARQLLSCVLSLLKQIAFRVIIDPKSHELLTCFGESAAGSHHRKNRVVGAGLFFTCWAVDSENTLIE